MFSKREIRDKMDKKSNFVEVKNERLHNKVCHLEIGDECR